MPPTQPSSKQPEQAPQPVAPELATPPVNQAPPPANPAPAPTASAGPPSVVVQPATPVAAPSATSNTPAVAGDVDVIEKEWVDAAEKVVKTSAEDPHKEEEGFENLQVGYLKKRYNTDIKRPPE